MWRHCFKPDNNMDYKIVFCDVDGTLLDDNHRMKDSTLKAIRALQRKGITFVIVTARGPSGIYPIFNRYRFTCPIVCYSGALIIDDDGKILYSNGFSRSTASQVISFIEERRLDCTWNIYSMDTWIVKDRSDARVAREERIVEASAVEGGIELLQPGVEVGKILCMCNPEYTTAIEEELKAKFPGLAIVRSSNILIEIMNKGISKGNSVRFFCEKDTIDHSATVAFGDHFNDVEMLCSVGKPFLMGNAPEELKDRFNHVTASNNDDGIYLGLRELGLVD